MNKTQSARQGVLFAFGAYTMWGIAPVYFKSLSDVPPLEILSHRVVWSFVFLFLILQATGKLTQLRQLVTQKKRLFMLCASALVIACNWLIFIWAVQHDHMLDASLGYFINPLFNVVLGFIFLGERFRPFQWIAIALASVGVVIQVVTFGSLPWVALVLACSFGCYGLLRKKININSAVGLFVETAVLLPVTLVYLFFFANSDTINLFNNSINTNLLLIAAGVITSVPLLCFNAAATRLKLSTLGFFQYLGPTLMFILAIGLYEETFSLDKAITFFFIWSALIVFVLDAWHQHRRSAQATSARA